MPKCTVTLRTAAGEFVAEVSCLPYVHWPEVMFWGGRLFLARDGAHRKGKPYAYHEADGSGACGLEEATQLAALSGAGAARIGARPIVIRGYSDDNVAWEDHRGGDEVGCYGAKPVLVVRDPEGEPALEVRPFYSGSWSFAVSRVQGSDYDLPDWPVRRAWEGYTEVLQIFAPDGCAVGVKDHQEE